jgi:hypothetical protein
LLKASVAKTFAISGVEDVNSVMKGVTEEDIGSVETAQSGGLALLATEGGTGLGNRRRGGSSSRGEQLGNTPLLKS